MLGLDRSKLTQINHPNNTAPPINPLETGVFRYQNTYSIYHDTHPTISRDQTFQVILKQSPETEFIVISLANKTKFVMSNDTIVCYP